MHNMKRGTRGNTSSTALHSDAHKNTEPRHLRYQSTYAPPSSCIYRGICGAGACRPLFPPVFSLWEPLCALQRPSGSTLCSSEGVSSPIDPPKSSVVMCNRGRHRRR